MTFREKSRWIALIANLVAWGGYFSIVATMLARGNVPDTPYLWALTLPAIITLGVIHVIGHVAVAIWNPRDTLRDSDAPADERDRAIQAHATNIAYTVLILGLMVAVTATFFNWTAFVAVNGALAAFIVAETARYAVEIAAYRGLTPARTR